MAKRSWYSTSSKKRLRPRFGFFRLRGFSLIFGFIPALKIDLRLALLSKPASRLSTAPVNFRPTARATRLRSFSPSGNSTISTSLTGAIVSGEPILCPTGHGGMLKGLAESGHLERLVNDGVEFIFYFQYPNVLEKVCDPVMLGYHCMGQYEVTTKDFHTYGADELLGRIVSCGKSLRVVEYFAVSPTSRPSWWNAAPASMATHVWNVSFLA